MTFAAPSTRDMHDARNGAPRAAVHAMILPRPVNELGGVLLIVLLIVLVLIVLHGGSGG